MLLEGHFFQSSLLVIITYFYKGVEFFTLFIVYCLSTLFISYFEYKHINKKKNSDILCEIMNIIYKN